MSKARERGGRVPGFSTGVQTDTLVPSQPFGVLRRRSRLRLICRARDRDDAEQRPYRWLVRCSDAAVPELTRLARTMDALREALLAHFDRRIQQRPARGDELLIRKKPPNGLNLLA